MFINSLGVTGVSAAVWAAATRNLSGPTTSDSSGPAGTNVTPGNGVKGAWTQLIAATTALSYAIIFVVSDTQSGGNFWFDIGVGPAAAEVAVIKDIRCSITTNVGLTAPVFVVPIVIAAGSRIAVRAQADFAAAAIAVNVTVLG